MARRFLTILIAVVLVFALPLGGGCANNAQTGAAIGAAGGALIGAIAGGADGFIIGTAEYPNSTNPSNVGRCGAIFLTTTLRNGIGPQASALTSGNFLEKRYNHC
jgi:hypothetical protein